MWPFFWEEGRGVGVKVRISLIFFFVLFCCIKTLRDWIRLIRRPFVSSKKKVNSFPVAES